MDRRQMALKLTADALQLDFRIDSFEDRLILQKAVYLAQVAGVHLGYYYRWYLRGPYSPSLTRDEYAVVEELARDHDESDGWALDEHSKTRLQGLQGLVGQGERADLARKLELLASVHFLITRKQVVSNDDHQIVKTLRRFGKDVDDRDVRGARGDLKRYGLL